MTNTRQPIVTVCGHVDHGKTSILDALRQSSVQEKEAGGITQKISFTSYPLDMLKKAFPIIEQSRIKLNIPGFLFIDTPGHAAFTNLRKRGGSLADLAILVIDINEGIKPQTAEVIQLLKANKTPFIIALNKIDNISGWRPPQPAIGDHERKVQSIKESIESQPQNPKQTFQERYMTLIGALNSHGFDSDLFYNINDFTKKIALVPCSARTKQGLKELIMVLCGLSQKYLADKLMLGKDAKGVMLEIKKQKSINYIEAILYDGTLSKTDEIAVANLEGNLIISKIRALEEIQPLTTKFISRESATASTGLRIQLIEKENILPGMPFTVFKNNKEQIQEEFKKQVSESIKSQISQQGIIVKADSLGSLEALLTMLKQERIPVVKAGIGNINKTDIASAKANLEINELDAVVLGFNISIDEDAKSLVDSSIKALTDDVIYKLIENLIEFRKAKADEIQKTRLMGLTTICKLKILHQYVFRNTNPAIFGVKIEAGKLISRTNIINESGEPIGKIKAIQAENKSVEEAQEGAEVAVSISGTNFERQLADKQFLYSDISETQFKNFKKNKDLLSQSEIQTLQQIAEIKQKEKPDWGV